jgi:hypothetical protein
VTRHRIVPWAPIVLCSLLTLFAGLLAFSLQRELGRGFGFALFSSPNTNAVMGSVESRFYGVASATLATMRSTGQMLSMGIAMLIFAVNIGDAAITPERYGPFLTSVRTAFIIFSILSCAGIFASLARGDAR